MQSIRVSQEPIFVVGYPRSGTTLLQSLLATQKNIISFPETHFFNETIKYITISPDGHIGTTALESALERMRIKAKLDMPASVRAILHELADQGLLSPKQFLEVIVHHFLALQVDEAELSNIRWLEKTPYHIFHLEQISCMYPQAKFVNIIRNPIPAIQSRKESFRETHLSTHGMAYLWQKSILGYEAFKHKHPNKIYSVQYEQLVDRPLDFLSDICHFLGIEPDLNAAQHFYEKAQQLVLPYETWKKGNLSKEIRNTNSNRRVPFYDVLNIQSVVHGEMRRYGYCLAYPRLHIVFFLIKQLALAVLHTYRKVRQYRL